MLPKLKYEYLLISVAAVWAILVSWSVQLRPALSHIGDDPSYLHAARLLYTQGRADAIRPMLIAAVQGLPYLFNASDSVVVKWGLLINLASWLATAILVFKIASARAGRKKGFFVALACIFLVGNLAVAFNFLSEPLYIFMMTASAYCAHRYLIDSQVKFIVFSIAILLAAALVKPVAAGMAVVFSLFFLRQLPRIATSRFIIFPVAGLLMLLIQMYSVKKNYGDFTLSYIGAITYHNYLGAKADCYRKNIEFVQGKNLRTLGFITLPAHEMKAVAAADFKEQLQHNTLNLGRAYLFCLWSNSHKGSFIISDCRNKAGTAYFEPAHFVLKAVAKLQNILLTLTGILLSVYILLSFKKEDPFLVLLSLMVLYIFFISGISCLQDDRFHIAFFPMVLVLVALKLWQSPRATYRSA